MPGLTNSWRKNFLRLQTGVKPYLAAGKIELIGGTYGQPQGTVMFSGESNIRQIVYGRNTILKALDYEMVTFLDEEEFSLIRRSRRLYLELATAMRAFLQVDTWGKAGVPHLEVNSFEWQGMDGEQGPQHSQERTFWLLARHQDPRIF